MDDVLVLDARYTSYQVRECFRRNEMDWPELWAGLIDATAASNLRALHDEFAPTYVVSSSWTKFLSREQLVEVFARAGLGFVVTNLHVQWGTPKGACGCRIEEIHNWLQAVFPGQAPVSIPMLALDDDESGWTLADSYLDKAGKVVLCEVWKGLTDEKLGQAQLQLRSQLAILAASPPVDVLTGTAGG
jgi:hypothetical protein